MWKKEQKYLIVMMVLVISVIVGVLINMKSNIQESESEVNTNKLIFEGDQMKTCNEIIKGVWECKETGTLYEFDGENRVKIIGNEVSVEGEYEIIEDKDKKYLLSILFDSERLYAYNLTENENKMTWIDGNNNKKEFVKKR